MMNNEGVLLRFNVDIKGRLSSYYGKTIVFPHRDWEHLIQSGDSWFCALDTISSSTVYFAIPVRKLDDEDFHNLIDNNMKSIAAIIWEDFHDDVMMSMDEFLSEEIRLKLESKQNEIDILKEELDKRGTIAQTNSTEKNTPFQEVTRIGPISLKSDFFANKVTVRLSPDLKRVVITNDPDGNYNVCNGVLDIDGFDAVLDYIDECKMIARIEDNSIIITMYDSISECVPSVYA